jgi:hypothetical protein
VFLIIYHFVFPDLIQLHLCSTYIVHEIPCNSNSSIAELIAIIKKVTVILTVDLKSTLIRNINIC